MNISIISFNYEEKNFKDASDVRFQVFVEELKFNKFNEFDTYDMVSIHYVVFIDLQPVASARAVESEREFTLEKLAVLRKYRSQGVGTLLLKYMITDLIKSKKDIIIYSQEAMKDFLPFIISKK